VHRFKQDNQKTISAPHMFHCENFLPGITRPLASRDRYQGESDLMEE
jgi:hypothetical protein